MLHPPEQSLHLSAIVITLQCYETIRRTVCHLQAQTARDRLEIVIVAPSAKGLGLVEADLAGVGAHQIVEVGPIESVPQARAAGIRQARAPIVVFTEDHSFPAPDWAAALIAAHRQPWAAVGPAVRNANPGGWLSWPMLLINYGRWLHPCPAGAIDDLPGHNSSYKRDVLLAYGDRLPDLLVHETLLHWDLRAGGRQLYLEPAAQTYHLNISRLRPVLTDKFHGQRMFAAARIHNEGFSAWQRLARAACAPLSNLRHLYGTLQDCWRLRRDYHLLPAVLPGLFVVLVATGLGEITGYLTGAGRSEQIIQELEFNRLRYIAEPEAQWMPGAPG